MRKQKGNLGKQALALLMSTMLFVSSMPMLNIGASEKGGPVAETVISAELPEEETTEVEVFSEDGTMELVDVNVEDFVEIPYSETVVGQRMEANIASVLSDSMELQPKVFDKVEQISDQFSFAYKDLVYNGSDSDNFCMLIAGDGYTSSEQNAFLAKAQEIADYFMTRAPFNEDGIKNKINIRAVCVVSNQSGVSMDPDNLYDTFFKSSFNNYGIERLICIHDQSALDAIIQQYMPECNVPFVIGNSTVYGGSGGSVCVLSAHNDSKDIAFHEFGHTGGGLADEYWETTTDASNRSEAPNRTADGNASTCKWSDLIGVNGVGLYEFDEAAGWYRPHQNCEMRYLYQEFCEVCKRQIRYKVNNVIQNKVGDNVVISTAAQLQEYAAKVSAGAKTYGKKVTLANSITLSGSNNLAVMWNFDGVFDGNGHTIYNININSGSGTAGFIGTLGSNGMVKNLCLSNVNITGNGYYIGGFVGNCKGTILQCGISGIVTGSNGVGGIAGHIESGLIQDCYSKATVNATSQVGGGIVGWGGGGTVNNCWSAGAATSGDGYWQGGVVGYNPSASVTNNYYLSGTASSGVAGNGDTGAAAKSSSEFSNGTVTNVLNSVSNVWKQGDGYPTFTYSSVNVEEQTTASASTGDGPQEVFGQLISVNTPGIIDVVWGAATNGQTYNVYVDGSIATSTAGAKLQNVGCAAYQIPASAGSHTVRITSVLNGNESVGVTGNVTVTGSFAETTTTVAAADGYTTAASNWNELNYWSVYFASGWAGDPTGSYKDGGSYSDFAVRVNTASNAEWGIQLKTQPISVTAGETYICRINANSSATTTSNVRIKDDISGTEKLQTLSAGSNVFELEFTASDKAQIFFDLGLMPAGLDFTITYFSLEKEVEETTTEEPTTRTFDAYATIEAEHYAVNQGGVIDTNSNASGGHNIGGVTNGVYMRYDNVKFSENAKGITLCYSSPSGIAQGNAEIYLESLDNKVGVVALTNNGSAWETYGMITGELDNEISAGSHTIYVKYVATGSASYVANVDYFTFVKASEYIEETTTVEETTAVVKIDGGIEINGYQVSATVKGMRTIYSVDSDINGKEVVASGIVYSLADYAAESELYVGSASKYVRSYESTATGVMSTNVSDSNIATSYVMTMKFATKEADEFTAKWRICAYAKLSDGSYVYTDAYEYTIYAIADQLHQGCKMNTKEHHDYLYTDILSIVDPAYKEKDFNWNNSIVGA